MKGSYSFQALKSKKVELSFTADEISSDGGLMLLREIDKKLKLTQKVASLLPDPRDSSKITHSWQSLLQQRVYAIAAGYEDLNDHDILRRVSALQVSVEREEALASSATLCRLEGYAKQKSLFEIHKIFVDTWLKSYSKEPKEIILDFDATDVELFGHQEERFYHGYYREYCYLPLHVFCGDHLLVSYLRPSNQDGAKHSLAILKLLVREIRKKFSITKMKRKIFRFEKIDVFASRCTFSDSARQA